MLLFTANLRSGGAASISGTLAATLDGVTVAASGVRGHPGTASATLADITATASGAVGHPGTLAATLDGVSFSASGSVGSVNSGSLAVTLGDVAANASGTLGHPGSLAVTLDPVGFSAAGTAAGSASITGTLAVTLDGIGFDATGAQPGGGAGDYSTKRRYVVKVGDKLVAFANKRDALRALDSQDKPEQAKPAKKPKPIEQVSLEAVRELAAERQALEHFQQQLAQLRYEALLRDYEQWREEQDIEDLLAIL